MSLQVLMTPDCQVICVGEDGQFYARSLSSEGPLEGLVGLVQQGGALVSSFCFAACALV
ncbi:MULTISPECIES: hypothetical protein [unclassified Saccharibacter]|uniref:hypothetical protein n=1 Tax=unclassified Saccharibacter TaxID=2648722 RepID=UPI001328D7B0|nr:MULTISPECIES: hypothetical protein [unclassified Saccharibacter]MXV35521.1 hypothetical protein [Saccharibacter sp. EH611]MXV58181.1 hypothetical protein [Saccharibacter sp. EH70]